MTDLLSILPSFPTTTYTHLIPSLEKNLITTTDLLTLDSLEIAKRAQLPLLDVKRLVEHVLATLQSEIGVEDRQLSNDAKRFEDVPREGDERWGRLKSEGKELVSRPWNIITLGDKALNDLLCDGIPTGYITEVVGESGAGKTQFLLSLLLHAQLAPPHGLARPTLYVSTEHPLPTPRLTQILSTSPLITTTSTTQPNHPSLAKILSIQTPDLESQDHILTYQLPVALARHDIGLVVIDSIAANYRAEKSGESNAAAMASRSAHLIKVGALLRNLAREHDCAIVVANQVADRFSPLPSASTYHSRGAAAGTAVNPSATQRSAVFSSSPASNDALNFTVMAADGGTSPAVMSLDHQQRFFTGWGASSPPPHGLENEGNLKTPSLGLTWANQIACRIALIKAPAFAKGGVEASRARQSIEAQESGEGRSGMGHRQTVLDDEGVDWAPRRWRRWMKVVFAPWAPPTGGDGAEFEVWEGGIRAVKTGDSD